MKQITMSDIAKADQITQFLTQFMSDYNKNQKTLQGKICNITVEQIDYENNLSFWEFLLITLFN